MLAAAVAAVLMAAVPAAAATYQVAAGDSLYAIAGRFGTTADRLAAANAIPDPDLIYPGQVLQIPGSGGWRGYTVRPGDSLWLIAQRTGTTVADLAARDNISDPNSIWPGEVLQVPATSGGPDLAAALQSAVQAVGGDAGRFGVYVRDLNSGREVAYNADQSYIAASTYKLPLAMDVMRLSELGQLSLDERLTYTSDDYEAGTGVIQGDPVGSGYAIRDLVRLAITRSDNIAANMLVRRVGWSALHDYMRNLGGATFAADGSNVTSPRDMGLYLQRLLDPAYLNDGSRTYLLDLLSHTEFNDRLPRDLPQGVEVAHKIGTYNGAVNDVGIVFAPGHAYIIAVMSRDMWDENQGADDIAAVSRTFYRFETSPS